MEMDMEDKVLYRWYKILGKHFNDKYAKESFVTAEEKAREQPASQSINQVLTDHAWKGKKLGPDRDNKMQYEAGSSTWGWDYERNLPQETIKRLMEGPVFIGELEYSLNPERHTVTKQKAK